MKVYITKYALTKGVLVTDRASISEAYPRMISIANRRGGLPEIYHKPDWHETEEDARTQVLKMIKSKLDSLERSRAELLDRLSTVEHGAFEDLIVEDQ